MRANLYPALCGSLLSLKDAFERGRQRFASAPGRIDGNPAKSRRCARSDASSSHDGKNCHCGHFSIADGGKITAGSVAIIERACFSGVSSPARHLLNDDHRRHQGRVAAHDKTWRE
jgi:hypothetical protein